MRRDLLINLPLQSKDFTIVATDEERFHSETAVLRLTLKTKMYYQYSPMPKQRYSMLPSIRTLQFKIAITFFFKSQEL